jgi:hypothetical protein
VSFFRLACSPSIAAIGLLSPGKALAANTKQAKIAAETRASLAKLRNN